MPNRNGVIMPAYKVSGGMRYAIFAALRGYNRSQRRAWRLKAIMLTHFASAYAGVR